MTATTVRRLLELGERSGLSLVLRYSGEVYVSDSDGQNNLRGLAAFELWMRLDVVPGSDPEGEGWEYFSASRGKSLRLPYFIDDDGEERTVAEAYELASSPSEYRDLIGQFAAVK